MLYPLSYGGNLFSSKILRLIVLHSHSLYTRLYTCRLLGLYFSDRSSVTRKP
jgi:hypothetical protein